MKKVLKSQATLFLLGFVFWLPVIVVIVIMIFLFQNLEAFGKQALAFFLPQNYIYPGLGIVFGIVVMYISGVILKLTNIKRLFSKIPLLGLFFGGGEVITIERLMHLGPCLFEISPTCISYGWILSEEKVKVNVDQAPFTLINIYFPNVPSLITGQVYPVRKETVIKLGNSSKEIIDLLLYAFRSPKDLVYLPWADESQEEFEKRARSFGLSNTGKADITNSAADSPH